MPVEKTIRSITGRQTTAGAAEETVALTLDGGAPAASIAVGVGTQLIITDWIISQTLPANWRLQQTNDGISFFDIALARGSSDGSIGFEFKTGIVVSGGDDVAIRVRVETPSGATAVTTTLRAYTEGT